MISSYFRVPSDLLFFCRSGADYIFGAYFTFLPLLLFCQPGSPSKQTNKCLGCVIWYFWENFCILALVSACFPPGQRVIDFRPHVSTCPQQQKTLSDSNATRVTFSCSISGTSVTPRKMLKKGEQMRVESSVSKTCNTMEEQLFFWGLPLQ